jgi:cytochrome bd-type quinol oxidase subunit 1
MFKSALLTYLLFSFVIADWNVFNYSQDTRVFMVFIWLCLLGLLLILFGWYNAEYYKPNKLINILIAL